MANREISNFPSQDAQATANNQFVVVADTGTTTTIKVPVGGVGGWVLLDSNSDFTSGGDTGNVDITVSDYTAFPVLKLVFSGWQTVTDIRKLIMFLDYGAGFEADTGDYRYASHFTFDTRTTIFQQTATSSGNFFITDNLGSDAGSAASGEITLWDWANGTERTKIHHTAAFQYTGTNQHAMLWGGGMSRDVDAVTRIRLKIQSNGDADGGSWALYGLKGMA